MLKIVVDAIPMQGLLTGINRYLQNLYAALENQEGVSIGYLTPVGIQSRRPLPAPAGGWERRNQRLRRLPPPLLTGLRAARWLRFESRLRRILPHRACHLYHETAFTPAAIGRCRPQVFTLHDLSLHHWRRAHPRERVWFADLFLKRRLPEADLIMTPSEFIRGELQRTFAIPRERIFVTPEAAAPIFRRLNDEECAQRLERLRRKGLPGDFILFVGSLEPRKNIDTLIRGLARCRSQVPLLLCGHSGWGAKPWREELRRLGLEKRVFYPGYVTDSELVALYNRALLLVYPSLYEGFGLPLLEAMACGCPVLTSNRASLPEVTGNAARLLEEPENPEEMATVLDELLSDRHKRAAMSRRGRKRAAQFTWERTARATLAVFRQAGS